MYRQDSLEFAPGDKVLAAVVSGDVGKPSETWVFNIKNGKLLAGPTPARCVFSPQGKVFALVSEDKLEIFDLESGARLEDLSHKLDKKKLRAVCFDADGSMIAAVEHDSIVIAFELHSGRERFRVPVAKPPFIVFIPSNETVPWPGREKEIYPLAWQVTNRCLAVQSPQYFLFYDLPTGQLVAKVRCDEWGIGNPDNTWSVRFPFRSTADGQAAVYGRTKGIAVFDLIRPDSKVLLLDLLPKANPRQLGVQLELGESVSSDKTLIAVQTEQGEEMPATRPPWISTWLAFFGIRSTPSSDPALVGFKLYNSGGEELRFFPLALSAAFSQDGKTLALAYPDGRIEFWDLPLGTNFALWLIVSSTAVVVTFIALQRSARRRALRLAMQTAAKNATAPAQG
ncbi:MAG TPA: WD40 repeat domain-containing protein [Gemmataceae bacterium]|nr:WD40 repeat domain-containing protein [Gemmataceae bacterium]